MTSEQLHDAITLLPADLIAETDKKRTAPRTPILWQRYAAMAACFALMICGSVWCLHNLGRGGTKEAAAEAPAAMQKLPEAPAAAAPEMRMDETAAEEAAPADAAEDSAMAENSTATATGGDTACFAAVPEITVTVTSEYGTHTLAAEDRAALARILSELTYLPENICECIAEITVTVNGEEKFRINLDEGFVRCDQGQAVLTADQAEALRGLLMPPTD